MRPLREPVAVSPRGEITVVRAGDLVCTVDRSGRARGAVDMSRLRPMAGAVPRLKDEASVLRIAYAKASAAGFPLHGASCEPPGPWGSEPGLVAISSNPTAFGYATNGFAGGTRMQVNRVSGEVASLAWTPEFAIDKPNLKITKAQAIKQAGPSLSTKKEKGRDYVSSALLQFFRPTPLRATAEGKRLLAARHLRLCWVVTMSYGKSLTEMSAPAAAVAIDAETGKQISKP